MSNNKYDQIIQAINDTTNQQHVDVYVPSVSRHVKFKPMTISHQKKIISTALDNTLMSNINHSILTTSIIEDCCLEPDVQLYAFDRNTVLVGLRCETLGYTVSTQDEDGEIVKQDIQEHVKSYVDTQTPADVANIQDITYNNIKIKIKPPTIQEDAQVSKQVYDKIKQNDFQDAETIRNTIGDAVLYEYVKYIKSVEIQGSIIPFEYEHVFELLRVVESLPITISGEILKVINNIKKIEDKFLQLTTQEKQLTIVTDARFYNTE